MLISEYNARVVPKVPQQQLVVRVDETTSGQAGEAECELRRDSYGAVSDA